MLFSRNSTLCFHTQKYLQIVHCLMLSFIHDLVNVIVTQDFSHSLNPRLKSSTRPAFVRLVGEKTQREERKPTLKRRNKRPITIQIQCGLPDGRTDRPTPDRRQKPPRIYGKRGKHST